MGDRRYHKFAAKPASGSVYEYHVAALEILDEEPAYQLGFLNTELRDDMDPRVRSFFERQNAFAQRLFDQEREEAAERFAAAGIPTPFAPEAEALLDEFVTFKQAAVFMNTTPRGGAASTKTWSIPPYKRVLIAAHILYGDTKGVALLNEGAARGSGTLARDHVGRAYSNFARNLPKTRLELGLMLTLIVSNFLILEDIRRMAARSTDLTRLRGRELTEVIDETRDLCDLVDKTANEFNTVFVPLDRATAAPRANSAAPEAANFARASRAR